MIKFANNFKSNKGFTLQDLILAIMILMLFVGTVGSLFISVYQVNADSKVDALTTIYAIKILEYIDKINYEEVTEAKKASLISKMQTELDIPNSLRVSLNITNYNPDWSSKDYVKQVRLIIDYTFNNKDKQLLIDTLKVKEL